MHGSKYESLVGALREMHAEVATSTAPHGGRAADVPAAGACGAAAAFDPAAFALPLQLPPSFGPAAAVVGGAGTPAGALPTASLC